MVCRRLHAETGVASAKQMSEADNCMVISQLVSTDTGGNDCCVLNNIDEGDCFVRCRESMLIQIWTCVLYFRQDESA